MATVGCGGGSSSSQAPAASQPAAAPKAAEAPAAVAAGDFGVPECDRYMEKYLACIDSKVPKAMQAMVRQGLDQSKQAWKKAAETPQGKAGLATACTQAEAAAKQAMSAYGCSW
jgi:hypothetical protein